MQAPAANENHSENLQIGSSSKQWGLYVWRGLGMSETSKHQKAMRQAMAVFVSFDGFRLKNISLFSPN